MPTELDTINRMLGAAGLSPVVDAMSPYPPYKKALTKLQQVSATLQSNGYWFNTSDVTLMPTVDGEVYIPQRAVRVNTTAYDASDVVLRGSRMYDLSNRTYNVGRSLAVRIVEVLDFDVLPMPAADLIASRATVEFFMDQGGQDPKLTGLRSIAMDADVRFKKELLANHRPQAPSYRRTQSWDKLYARSTGG